MGDGWRRAEARSQNQSARNGSVGEEAFVGEPGVGSVWAFSPPAMRAWSYGNKISQKNKPETKHPRSRALFLPKVFIVSVLLCILNENPIFVDFIAYTQQKSHFCQFCCVYSIKITFVSNLLCILNKIGYSKQEIGEILWGGIKHTRVLCVIIKEM